MRTVRIIIRMLVVIFLIVDGIVLYNLWHYGWPSNVTAKYEKETIVAQFVPVALDTTGWIKVAIILGFQIGLIYLAWRLRKGHQH